MAEPGLQASLATTVLLPAALAFIMFGMGMTLTTSDFTRIGRAPRAVAVGLAAQVLLLPLLGVGVAVAFHHLFGLAPVLALGLILLACCPGGPTSNLVTYLARADTALSVTLTSIASLASALLTPLTFLAATTLVFGEATLIRVSLLEMVVAVALMVVAPVLLGMLTRRHRPSWAARSERPFRIASIAFLALVIAGAILQNRATFWADAAATVPAALTLNVLALAAGLAVARAARLPGDAGRAISIEVGFQNGTLGIALALGQLASPGAALAPAFYSLVMFLTGGALAWWWSRHPPAPGPRDPPRKGGREGEDRRLEGLAPFG